VISLARKYENITYTGHVRRPGRSTFENGFPEVHPKRIVHILCRSLENSLGNTETDRIGVRNIFLLITRPDRASLFLVSCRLDFLLFKTTYVFSADGSATFHTI
jgi:hypothetical protein